MFFNSKAKGKEKQDTKKQQQQQQQQQQQHNSAEEKRSSTSMSNTSAKINLDEQGRIKDLVILKKKKFK